MGPNFVVLTRRLRWFLESDVQADRECCDDDQHARYDKQASSISSTSSCLYSLVLIFPYLGGLNRSFLYCCCHGTMENACRNTTADEGLLQPRLRRAVDW